MVETSWSQRIDVIVRPTLSIQINDARGQLSTGGFYKNRGREASAPVRKQIKVRERKPSKAKRWLTSWRHPKNVTTLQSELGSIW